MTSTIKHIKDDAKYVKLNGVHKDVQSFYDALGEYVFKGVGLPIASETVSGISRYATQKEVDEGLSNTTIVSPKTLTERIKKPEATEDVVGISRYTKNDEALNYDNKTSATPKTVKYIFDNNNAKENNFGTIKIASTAQAIAGTDDTNAITPLKLKQAISTLVPTHGIASESVLGLTKMATVAQVREGKIREGFSISPYTFSLLNGTESLVGVYRVAKNNEVNGDLDNVVITPKKLNYFINNKRGDNNNLGIVKLSETKSNDANTALSSKADVMYRVGGNFSGRIYNSSATEANKYITKGEIENLIKSMSSDIPVGTIVMRYAYANSGDWMVCDGRWMDKASYPALFAAIGNSVSATHFALPDMRNIFPRGADNSGRKVGLRESDMIRRHKHVMPWGEYAKSSVVSPWGGTNNRWRYGSNRSDNDNYWYHTNDGSDYDGQVNPSGVIGHETRPANVAVAFLIKVK